MVCLHHRWSPRVQGMVRAPRAPSHLLVLTVREHDAGELLPVEGRALPLLWHWPNFAHAERFPLRLTTANFEVHLSQQRPQHALSPLRATDIRRRVTRIKLHTNRLGQQTRERRVVNLYRLRLPTE